MTPDERARKMDAFLDAQEAEQTLSAHRGTLRDMAEKQASRFLELRTELTLQMGRLRAKIEALGERVSEHDRHLLDLSQAERERRNPPPESFAGFSDLEDGDSTPGEITSAGQHKMVTVHGESMRVPLHTTDAEIRRRVKAALEEENRSVTFERVQWWRGKAVKGFGSAISGAVLAVSAAIIYWIAKVLSAHKP